MLKKLKNNLSLKYKTALLNRNVYLSNLNILNFGNASIIDRKKNIIFVKASGTSTQYCNLKDIVKIKIPSYKQFVTYKDLKPSVDTPIHITLYKYLKNIKSIVHTHSEYATILAQANIEPSCFGTTHADFFRDKIPLSEKIKKVDSKQYEQQLAYTVIKKLKKIKYNVPGMLLRDHGVIAWGKDENESLLNAIAIEFICKLYYKNILISKKSKISNSLKAFHFNRKNGINKYYGQY
jgi:L-ribulose-5-phosphate 4-epimerase